MSAVKKVVKKDGSSLSDLETKIAQELHHLETSNSPIKADVESLYINAARVVQLEGNKSAVVLFVPFPLLPSFRKIQKQLVDELEKKLQQSVVIIANRTMLSAKTWSRSTKYTGVRSRTRSLKAVQEALLDDIVYPSEITGKRIRVRSDGSRLLKVHLNPKDAGSMSDKVDTFRAVYKNLTNKDVAFGFEN
jgi:small subunit ribosomal protein S7e